LLTSKVCSLKCYQCESYSSEPCPEEDLKECPSNQAYDRCLVKIYKSPTERFLVKRECALAPCNLRDKAVDSIIKLRQNCDMTKETFDCVYCCKYDGCNKDGESHISANVILLLSCIFVSAVRLT
ncbi:hypothetical protein B4U80_04369, partial [Leptotrombidium deliense]